MLIDVAQQPVYNWEADNVANKRMFYIAYDELRRPLSKTVTIVSPSATKVLEKMEYVDGPTGSTANNMRGQLLHTYDGAGKHTIIAYDFKGNPLQLQENLLALYDIEADWMELPLFCIYEASS